MSKPPVVLVDARMVGPIPHGIARYVEHMAKGLRERKSLPYELCFLMDKAQYREQFEGWPTVATEIPFLHKSELFKLGPVIESLRVKLFHSPSFSSLLKCPCPWVMTIHDLNHLQFGSLQQKLYYRWVLKPFAKKASGLMTVSEKSRKEISDWLGQDISTIDVVPNAFVQPPPQTTAEENENLLAGFKIQPNKYIFCLSNSKPHKNLSFLIGAYSEYRTRVGEAGAWPLVLTVRPAEVSKTDGVLAIGAASDREVEILLKKAGAFVAPSLYEGFGRPPLEAAIEGVPIIVSDIPVHREVLDSVPASEVVFAPPQDQGAWVDALVQAHGEHLSPPSSFTRANLLRFFSIERLAEGVDQVYRRVLGLKA